MLRLVCDRGVSDVELSVGRKCARGASLLNGCVRLVARRGILASECPHVHKIDLLKLWTSFLRYIQDACTWTVSVPPDSLATIGGLLLREGEGRARRAGAGREGKERKDGEDVM